MQNQVVILEDCAITLRGQVSAGRSNCPVGFVSMSIRKFIQSTHLLIQQGLYETRNVSRGYQRSLELTHLEERVLFSASAVAPVLAEIAQVGGDLF